MKIKKLALGVLTFCLVAPVVYILVASLLLSPVLVYREILYSDSDVYDYQYFPGRQLESSSTPFRFQSGTADDENHTRPLLASVFQTNDLDTFLDSTSTQALIVIQNDRILYERYFHGTSRESVVTSFSAAKGFVSALVGIAIAEGKIASVDDSITKYLPELAARDPRFSAITIRHLLMMNSGIQSGTSIFPFFSDDGLTYYHPDLRSLALQHTRIQEPPGQHFVYNYYNPLLLGLILERTTGVPVTQYLQDKLWTPLGTEYAASWSLDSESDGFEKMGHGINARAIDFAKLGRLYLEEGNWNGNQLVPADWISYSTQADISLEVQDLNEYYKQMWSELSKSNGYYHYFWWVIRRNGAKNDFTAWGALGQFIYVSPQANLIVVRNGEQFGMDPMRWIDGFYRLGSEMNP